MIQSRLHPHPLKLLNSVRFPHSVSNLTPVLYYKGCMQQRRPYSTPNEYAKLTTDPTIARQYFRPCPNFTNTFSLDELYRDFILIPDFLPLVDHNNVVQHCQKKLNRSLGRSAPYEQGHFDGVITGYKECSASSWTVGNSKSGKWMEQLIQQRIYDTFFPSSFKWLSPHILDLCATGEIRGHVDNLEASGSVVAGLCLKSPAKMILEHEKDPTCKVEIFLPARCFYIQRDSVRYQFKHAIAGPKDSIWDGKPFEKLNRISLMFRNQKEPRQPSDPL